MYRVKPKGRYQYRCRGCGVYIKIKTRFCRGCILDLLSEREAGTWRKEMKPAKRLPQLAPGDLLCLC